MQHKVHGWQHKLGNLYGRLRCFIVCEGRYSDTCTIVSKSDGTTLNIEVVSRPPDI
jgi:hypothetical protein